METAAGELTWVRSTRSSSNGGACVEVAAAPGRVLVRDSKDRSGPVLGVDPDSWRRFVQHL